MKLNTGFTAAWLSMALSLKYTDPILLVDSDTPPLIPMNITPPVTINSNREDICFIVRLPPLCPMGANLPVLTLFNNLYKPKVPDENSKNSSIRCHTAMLATAFAGESMYISTVASSLNSQYGYSVASATNASIVAVAISML